MHAGTSPSVQIGSHYYQQNSKDDCSQYRNVEDQLKLANHNGMLLAQGQSKVDKRHDKTNCEQNEEKPMECFYSVRDQILCTIPIYYCGSAITFPLSVH
jgi:hypothetical protein